MATPSELTRLLKTVYRVFRILSHEASVSCTKKHCVRYRVSTVKNQVYENSFRKRILTVFSKNSLVKVCFVCHHISNFEKKTYFPLRQNWPEWSELYL